MTPLEMRTVRLRSRRCLKLWPALRRRPLSPSEASKLGARTSKKAVPGMTRDRLLDPNVVTIIAAASGKRHVKRNRIPMAVNLSARETEVLRRISLGASNKEVARALELSPSTVRTHVESVFRKLECSTRAAATLKASAMGLLSR